jgi:hypothetical protein
MGTLLVLVGLALWASASAIVVGAMRLLRAARYVNAQRVLLREIEAYRGRVPVGIPA